MPLAQKNTGNYLVKLKKDEEGYYLDVTYLGEWSSGEEVSIGLASRGTSSAVKRNFRSRIRGDLDVADLLVIAGFDQYLNQQRPPRDVTL